MTIPLASLQEARGMEDIEFVRENAEDPAARTTTELTGWELVVFELADEEEPGE